MFNSLRRLAGKKHRRSARPRSSVRLAIEQLEDRRLLSGIWTALAHSVPSGNGTETMLLLSDGTVMVQGGGTGGGASSGYANVQAQNWYKLTPAAGANPNINYDLGTWSQLANMNLQRLFYASNVLPDGRVLVLGGEYSGPNLNANANDTPTGEIYNPTANGPLGQWTNTASVPSPSNQFGDDPTTVLPGGLVLTGDINTNSTYIYNPANNTWQTSASLQKHYNDRSDEESWVKLADGSILTYDVYASSTSGQFLAERFITAPGPNQNTWVDASTVASGAAPSLLSSLNVGFEMGPAFLLPDGRAFFIGGNGATAFYTPSASGGSWTAGPSIPGGLLADDAPGAMMPNGDILFAADSSQPAANSANFKFAGPVHIFEFNPTTNVFTDVTPPNYGLATQTAFKMRMLELPSGQVLVTNGSDQLMLYTPNEGPNAAWRPAISRISNDGGNIYTLSGTGLNGISEGAAYGDDAEMASNYPIIQFTPLTGPSAGGVVYGRTSNWSLTGVQTGSTPETVQFTPPPLPLGPDLVSVSGAGIASPTVLYDAMNGPVDNVVLQLDVNNGAFLQVLDGGSLQAEVPLSSFSSIMIAGDVKGTMNLTVNYGNGFFSAPVTFAGNPGALNTLNVTDAGDAPSTAWTVTGASISGHRTISSLTGAVNYTGVQTVNLNTSNGGTVNVLGTSVTTNVIAAGATKIEVADKAGGNIQDIHGTLNLENPGNYNTIDVNDSADHAAHIVTLSTLGANPSDSEGNTETWGSITGLSQGAINYEYVDTAGVTLTTSSGGCTVNVQGTGAPIQLFNNAAATVNVGNHSNMQGINGALTIENPPNYTVVNLDDSADPLGRSVNLGSYTAADGVYGQITGLAPAAINYRDTDVDKSQGVSILTGTGDNSVNVQAVGALTWIDLQGTTTNFNDVTVDDNATGGPGSVKGVVNQLNVYGSGIAAANQVFLFDNGNTTTADQVTVTGSGINSDTSGSFFGPGGSMTYSGVDVVNVYTSNAPQGDHVTVYPARGMSFYFSGGNPTTTPGDTLIVEPLGGAVLTLTSTATGAGYLTLPGSTTQLVRYSGFESVTPVGLLVVAPDAGYAPDVQVYDAQSGALKYDLHPFAKDFLGGVRAAVGDVNGDGIPDIITAQGPGGGTIQVFDGSTGLALAGPLGSFTPFGPDYHGGLWVTAADVNGDGYADVIVGEDAGGEPRVRIFSGKDGSLLADFLAFDPSFHGGVRVAAADFNHDGHADIVAGEGPGGQAVNVFEGAALSLGQNTPTPAFSIAQPIGPHYDGGVYVGTGDVFGDGVAKILVSQGAGADPILGVFNGAAQGAALGHLVVYGFQDGARVTAADVNGDGRADIVVADGQGNGVVRGYDGLSLQEDGHFTAFPNFAGGMFVGGFGHWGDFTTAVGRSLGGPQGALQSAVADLTTVQASLAATPDGAQLGDALDLLYTALNAPAWTDNSHLSANGGQAVFTAEDQAISLLVPLLRNGALPTLQGDLHAIVQSAADVAQAALVGADPRHQALALADFVEGEQDFAAAFLGPKPKADKLDDVIDDFRAAWEKALETWR